MKLIRYLRQFGMFFLVLLLLGLSMFSLYRYAPLLKAKQELDKQNQEARAQLVSLRSDLNTLVDALKEQKSINQQIHKENINLEAKLGQLQQDLNITQEQLELLTSSLLALNRENASLQEDKQTLAERLEKILEDNKSMLSKISSVEELKKMIVQIKEQVFRNKMALQKKLDQKKLAEGNHGFVVKDGKTTHQPKVHIEVNPAS